MVVQKYPNSTKATQQNATEIEYENSGIRELFATHLIRVARAVEGQRVAALVANPLVLENTGHKPNENRIIVKL